MVDAASRKVSGGLEGDHATRRRQVRGHARRDHADVGPDVDEVAPAARELLLERPDEDGCWPPGASAALGALHIPL
jgi:hypothetical protein